MPPAAAEAEPAIAVATAPLIAIPKKDLWMRIRGGFRLADLDSPRVKEHENWYANRPDYIRRMTERSQLYLFHIVEEVERRKLPSEIALLPMIESAFNPRAYSSSHASGIWQFIPSTGRYFGLDQNWWYDGRRNVLAATNAALDYLEKLYRMFDSWELALAAYNAGEGTVSRAIAHNRARGLSTNYLSLNLSAETRNYVPKLLAIKRIIADPGAFGLTLNDVPNKPFFTTVEIKKHIDVALAARFANMTVDEFVALNPAYNKPLITFNDNERLLLPTANVNAFIANMRRYGDRQLHSWQAYPAKKGERVDKIATKFGITISNLRSLNTVRETKGKLASSQLLLVPLHPTKPLPTEAQIAAAQFDAAPSFSIGSTASQNYLVQKGDTLFALARDFGMSVDALAARNRLVDGAIKVGETLIIPGSEQKGREGDVVPVSIDNSLEAKTTPLPSLAQATAGKEISKAAKPAPAMKPSFTAAKPSFYTVKRGDTLASIARSFQVAVADLVRWNKLGKASTLRAGARVKVFVGKQ